MGRCQDWCKDKDKAPCGCGCAAAVSWDGRSGKDTFLLTDQVDITHETQELLKIKAQQDPASHSQVWDNTGITPHLPGDAVKFQVYLGTRVYLHGDYIPNIY